MSAVVDSSSFTESVHPLLLSPELVSVFSSKEAALSELYSSDMFWPYSFPQLAGSELLVVGDVAATSLSSSSASDAPRLASEGF